MNRQASEAVMPGSTRHPVKKGIYSHWILNQVQYDKMGPGK